MLNHQDELVSISKQKLRGLDCPGPGPKRNDLISQECSSCCSIDWLCCSKSSRIFTMSLSYSLACTCITSDLVTPDACKTFCMTCNCKFSAMQVQSHICARTTSKITSGIRVFCMLTSKSPLPSSLSIAAAKDPLCHSLLQLQMLEVVVLEDPHPISTQQYIVAKTCIHLFCIAVWQLMSTCLRALHMVLKNI